MLIRVLASSFQPGVSPIPSSQFILRLDRERNVENFEDPLHIYSKRVSALLTTLLKCSRNHGRDLRSTNHPNLTRRCVSSICLSG